MKKKNIFSMLLIFMLCSSLIGETQVISATKVTDTKLVSLLNRVRTYHLFQSKDLNVKVFLVGGESGSAKLPGSDEVVDQLFFAVSEFDEYPRQSLFHLDNIFDAKNFIITKTKPGIIWMTFDMVDNKGILKKRTSKITLNGIIIN